MTKTKKPTELPAPYRQQLTKVEQAQCDLWHNEKVQEAFAEAHTQLAKLDRIVYRIGIALSICETNLKILGEYKRQDREIVKNGRKTCRK